MATPSTEISPGVWTRNLGAAVRRHRKLAGLNQAELARLAGVGKTVIHDLEKGKPTMQIDTVLKILAALNIRLEWTSPLGEAGDA
ncbi:MAG: helix-turn-helix transcriptional regulator [Candidatus Krumholzibacteriia bacterium]